MKRKSTILAFFTPQKEYFPDEFPGDFGQSDDDSDPHPLAQDFLDLAYKQPPRKISMK
jgi:hypothetical protein